MTQQSRGNALQKSGAIASDETVLLISFSFFVFLTLTFLLMKERHFLHQ